jgi:hypothetical protein
MKLIVNVPWLASVVVLSVGALSGSSATTSPASSLRASEEPSFHSVAGRKLEKHFVQHSELDLKNSKVSVEGPDGPEDQEGEGQSLKIIDDETIEFTDETVTAGDGKPKKAKRSFTTIENSVNYESDAEGFEAEAIKNQSGLLEKTVAFTWDSDDKAFTAAWFECEGDDDLLKPMVEDADFRGWLPGKKVAEDDTWNIEVSEFNNLQEPSGPMGYKREGAENESEDDPMSDGLRANRKGEIKATFKGTRDVDGVKLGVIAFTGKLSTSFEHEAERGEEGGSVKRETELSDELEGELLWDLAAGHFYSLNCDAAIKMNTTEAQSFEIEGSTFKLSQSQSFEGKKTYRFTCAEKKD